MGITRISPGERYHRARARYKHLIEASFREVEFLFSSSGIQFSLTEIDADSLKAWEKQWPKSWKWDYLCKTQLTAIAKRFTIAIWDGDTLVGLCFGKVSRGRRSVSIAYLESNSNYVGTLNRMVAAIATATAKSLGKKVGASYVTMLDPVNEQVEQHYKNIGYSKLRAFGDRKSMHIKID